MIAVYVSLGRSSTSWRAFPRVTLPLVRYSTSFVATRPRSTCLTTTTIRRSVVLKAQKDHMSSILTSVVTSLPACALVTSQVCLAWRRTTRFAHRRSTRCPIHSAAHALEVPVRGETRELHSSHPRRQRLRRCDEPSLRGSNIQPSVMFKASNAFMLQSQQYIVTIAAFIFP